MFLAKWVIATISLTNHFEAEFDSIIWPAHWEIWQLAPNRISWGDRFTCFNNLALALDSLDRHVEAEVRVMRVRLECWYLGNPGVMADPQFSFDMICSCSPFEIGNALLIGIRTHPNFRMHSVRPWVLNFTNVVPYLGTCTLSPGYKKQIVDPIIFEPGDFFTDSRGLRWITRGEFSIGEMVTDSRGLRWITRGKFSMDDEFKCTFPSWEL